MGMDVGVEGCRVGGAGEEPVAVSVDVARAEQKFEALSATMQQQRRDQSQREAAVDEVSPVQTPLPPPSTELSSVPLLATEPSLNT